VQSTLNYFSREEETTARWLQRHAALLDY